MNRDALLATLIGFAIGILITAGLLFGPELAKFFPDISLPTITLPRFGPKPSPATPANTLPTELVVDSPLPDAIETKSTVLVSGSAVPGSVVVIQNEQHEEVATPNGDGKFAAELTLSEGSNTLLVTMYDHGKASTKTLTVYYTQEEF